MKVFTILILACFSTLSFGDGLLSVIARKNAAVSPPPTLLIDEDCEGTGTPSGWTDTGTVDWDETGSAIVGTESLLVQSLDTAYYVEYSSLGASGKVYVKIWFYHWDSPGASKDLFSVRDSSGNELAALRNQSNNFTVAHGSATLSAGSFSDATNYVVWLDYTPSTGGNGVLDFSFSTTDSKPGSPQYSITTGTSTANVDRLRVGASVGFPNFVTYDEIQLSESEI